MTAIANKQGKRGAWPAFGFMAINSDDLVIGLEPGSGGDAFSSNCFYNRFYRRETNEVNGAVEENGKQEINKRAG